MAVAFRILGQLEVSTVSEIGEIGTDTPIAVAAGHARQLLTVLLLHEGRLVGIDTLAEVLWDDDPPPSYRKLIQARISQLRRLLGPSVELAGSRAGLVVHNCWYGATVGHRPVRDRFLAEVTTWLHEPESPLG